MIQELKQSDLSGLRQDILKEQNGRCPICLRIIEQDEACLDHEHKRKVKGSGLIRGVLCRGCNVFLGKMENNCRRYGINHRRLPQVLRRVSKYLQEKHRPFLHPSERQKEPKLQVSSYNRLKRYFEKNYSGRMKFPSYPKSGKLTVKLKGWYIKFDIEPKFYSK